MGFRKPGRCLCLRPWRSRPGPEGLRV